MLSTLIVKIKNYNVLGRYYSANLDQQTPGKFETVFSFPFIKYLATFNRLKVYHGIGTLATLPSCGVLEMVNIFPQNTLLTAACIGISGLVMLSTASLPFRNVIGFLYISEDNKHIKISSLDFWGRRIDKIVNADDWVPLLDMAPNKLDLLYLSPQLADGTKYKLFLKFGHVLNSSKMGQVLE